MSDVLCLISYALCLICDVLPDVLHLMSYALCDVLS